MATPDLSSLSSAKRTEALKLLDELTVLHEQNPLYGFHACLTPCGEPGCRPHPKQHQFLVSNTPITAVFAGNREGKTAGLVLKALCQVLPDEFLPERLQAFRHRSPPCYGRIVVPGLDTHLYGVVLPEFMKWTPQAALLGGAWEKAWDKQRRMLRFDCGSWLQFMSYDMHVNKFGGASLDFVGYDEPPPEDIRRECRMRLIDRGGLEWFAMTPVNMAGGGIGWIYRSIFKRKDHPAITVINASIHDNPHLPKAEVEFVLNEMGKDERAAREFGEFIHMGGMVYPGGFENHLCPPPAPESLKDKDIVVGIDPGLKVAAFVWVAFDNDNIAYVFDEQEIKEGNALDYRNVIERTNAKWGNIDPLYVVDPSFTSGSLATGQSVKDELRRQGIFALGAKKAKPGEPWVEAGVQQIRRRMAEGGFFCSEACTKLRDVVLEYRMEDREDGVFKAIRENIHLADSTRYAISFRPWYAEAAGATPTIPSWEPGQAPSWEYYSASRQLDHY